MDNYQVIGIDLGGTAIKLGRFTVDGTCLQYLAVPTPQPAIPQAAIATMVDAIAKIDPENQTQAIGVGTPGPADAEGRIARLAINLPQWYNIPLASEMEARTGKATVVANDANCAGLGEAWLGAGLQFQNFILLTLGTGVGGAIILDGNLFVGHQGAAGELGLITFNPQGPMCQSGNQGSLEQFTSATAIYRRTGKKPHELADAATSGDTSALKFWQEYGRDLGIGLTSLIYVLTPEAIVIGGGVSASAKFFLPSTIAEVKRRVTPNSRVNLEIFTSKLGNSAGMLGAAKLALALI